MSNVRNMFNVSWMVYIRLDQRGYRPHVARPDLARKVGCVGLHVVEREVLTDALDIAGEEREDIRVVIGIDGLGKVDQRDFALPVENIIGRKVAVNAPVDQGQLDVAHDTGEVARRLLWGEQYITQSGRGLLCRADIFHEYCIAKMREGLRHVGAVFVHDALSLVLVLDPGRVLGGATFRAFASSCASTAPVPMLRLAFLVALDTAETINGVVAQIAEHPRPIDLGP